MKTKTQTYPSDELIDGMSLEEYLDWYERQDRKPNVRVKGDKQRGAAASVDWGQVLIDQLAAAALPLPVREHRFHPTRKWRLDLAWLDLKLAVEIDGGLYARPVVCPNCHQTVRRLVGTRWVVVREGGRHTTGRGRENDIEKENEAQLLGWRVLHVTPEQVQKLEALTLLMRAL